MPNNPAINALRRAVNRSIANGAAIVEEKPTLSLLKERADMAGDAFDKACRPFYCDGRWGAYRAYECGQDVPPSVDAAFNAYHAATMAFYAARDGASGFLGARGV